MLSWEFFLSPKTVKFSCLIAGKPFTKLLQSAAFVQKRLRFKVDNLAHELSLRSWEFKCVVKKIYICSICKHFYVLIDIFCSFQVILMSGLPHDAE